MNREEFLANRRSGIGGSDVAACLGLSPWRTPVQVWENKTGRETSDINSDAAHFGTILEDIVAKEFSSRMGLRVQKVNTTMRSGENGWQIANIDRAVVNPDIAGRVFVLDEQAKKETGRQISTDTILECKTANSFSAHLWGETQEHEIKAGQIVTEHKIPIYYETQVQWYMGITGAKTCYVAVLIGGQDFRIYKVDRNEEVIEALTRGCFEFWHEYVVKDLPPQPVNIDDVRRLYKIERGPMIEATNEVAIDVGEIRTIRERIDELKKQEEAVKTRLAIAIGDAEGITLNGERVVTFKAQKSCRFDSTAFKKSDPLTWNRYAKESVTRVLKIY